MLNRKWKLNTEIKRGKKQTAKKETNGEIGEENNERKKRNICKRNQQIKKERKSEEKVEEKRLRNKNKEMKQYKSR